MCRRRGYAPRLDVSVALATIGTAAAFDRHDTPRHPAPSRWPPGWWPLTCAGFRVGADRWCRRGADCAAEKARVNLLAAGGVAHRAGANLDFQSPRCIGT